MALTQEQDAIVTAITDAIYNPEIKHITISGPAGAGKTYMLHELISVFQELKLLNPIYDLDWNITATTNKAVAVIEDSFASMKQTCENISICTYAKLLGFNVDPKTNKLVARREIFGNHKIIVGDVIIIDESSYLNEEAVALIQQHTATAALVIYIGDEYQLPPVSGNCPVFQESFGPQYRLTRIERQADDSPIQKASALMRQCVANLSMPDINLDGKDMQWLDRDAFVKAYVADLTSSPAGKVRALAWKNVTARYYNDVAIHAFTGRTELQIGDIVICNAFHLNKRARLNIPSEATVRIINLDDWEVDSYGVVSRNAETNYGVVRIVREPEIIAPYQWVDTYADLRFAYASTINKAQGSTFDTVYIDLDDINQCKSFDLKLRLAYVAISRARYRIVFTGDISQ